MKNIVVCCDGTSNDISGAPTNVLRMYRCLERNESQLTYYDSGVGTIADPSVSTDPGKAVSKTLDMAVGFSVKRQVCTAYKFLVRHWEKGDRIYLVGFSRGAYAVRALAGMINQLGLLRREAEHLDEMGWSVYSTADFLASSNFKYAFSNREPIPIHFVGVWDTVSSFGTINNFKTLPDTRNNPSIEHVRHAVALDEKRACFQPNLFGTKFKDDQDIVETWFPGCHSDVGGGYPEKESGIAKFTLEWMISHADQLGCRFDQDQVDFFMGRTQSDIFQCPPDISGPVHNSIQGWLWNAAEWVPRRFWSSKAGGMKWHGPNFYRRRKIPKNADIYGKNPPPQS